MADFSIAYYLTNKIEGGWANNSNDRGGETYKGIARKMHPEWSGWLIVDAAKKQSGFPSSLSGIPDLESSVKAFYKQEFWNYINLDSVNDQKTANALYDTAVNCGQGIAALYIQRALNACSNAGRDYSFLPLTGQVRIKTLAALNGHKRPNDVLKAFECLRGAHYISIAENNPSQGEFMASWLSRVNL